MLFIFIACIHSRSPQTLIDSLVIVSNFGFLISPYTHNTEEGCVLLLHRSLIIQADFDLEAPLSMFVIGYPAF